MAGFIDLVLKIDMIISINILIEISYSSSIKFISIIEINPMNTKKIVSHFSFLSESVSLCLISPII